MSYRLQARISGEGFIETYRREVQEGILRAGDKLPSERELAAQYNVARNTVRRWLDSLERDGMIVRLQGAGAFVASQQDKTASAVDILALLESMLAGSSPEEVLQVQSALEPQMAVHIVARATDAELGKLEHYLQEVERSRSIAEFEHADKQLHRAICAATHNRLLITLLEIINLLRHDTVWGVLRSRGEVLAKRETYEYQHRAIVTALRNRNAEEAAAAIRAHVRTVHDEVIPAK